MNNFQPSVYYFSKFPTGTLVYVLICWSFFLPAHDLGPFTFSLLLLTWDLTDFKLVGVDSLVLTWNSLVLTWDLALTWDFT